MNKHLFLCLVTFLTFCPGARAGGQDIPFEQRAPAVRDLNLDGQWQLTYGPVKSADVLKQVPATPPPDDITIPATVPGNVELDMIAAGRLPDLKVGMRAREALKLEVLSMVVQAYISDAEAGGW